LLDANTYIQAKNQYYGMDICPAYWDWLDLQFEQGLIGSVDMIGRELRDGNDDDEATQSAFAAIVQSVMEGDYNAGNRDSFLAKADPWIIAKAQCLGATVVTHESVVAPNARKVKVPNICQQFDVTCINTFQFLRELNARFVLGT
jgi:hypothetical protein